MLPISELTLAGKEFGVRVVVFTTFTVYAEEHP
jgi:hypothetical protein